jgi:hypothetical protein
MVLYREIKDEFCKEEYSNYYTIAESRDSGIKTDKDRTCGRGFLLYLVEKDVKRLSKCLKTKNYEFLYYKWLIVKDDTTYKHNKL